MPDFRIRLNTEIDSGNAKAELEKLISNFTNDPLKIKVDTGDATKGISQLTSDLKKLKEVAEKIKIGGTSSSGSGGFKKQTDSALSEFKKLTNEYNALQKQLSKETNAKSIQVLTKQLNEVYSAAEKVKSKLSGTDLDLAKQFESTSGRKLETNFLKTFNNIAQQAESLGGKINKAFNDQNFDVKGLEKVKSEFKEIQNTIENFNMSEMNSVSLNSLTTDLNKIQNEFKQLSNSAQQVKLENKFDIDCTKAINQLNKLKTEYESIGKDTSGIVNMINDIKRLQSEIDSVELGKLKGEFDSINTQVKSMQTEMSGAMKHVKSGFSDFTSSLSAFTIGNLAGDALAGGIYNLKDEILSLDEAMTNVKKVANEADINSAQKIKDITSTAVNIAKEVAGSVPDVTNSIAESIKLGFSDMNVAEEIAKYSQIFANVGDMGIGEATKGIATVLNTFKIDPLKEYSVEVDGATKKTTELANAMDILNYAGNTQAIDMQGLTQAFQTGGATLASYGVGLKESTALITAANNAIQDPSRVGNGLKTIAVNMAGLKTSAKDGKYIAGSGKIGHIYGNIYGKRG